MDNVKELITLGKQYFDRKEYQRAANYLQQAIEKNGSYADVHNMLGVIHHIEGKFETAMDAFRKALKLNPRYTEAILNLAVLYNDLGHYKEAKKLYVRLKQGHSKTSTQIEPVLRGKLSNLHAEIGDIYRSIGLNTFAINEYQKALDLNANYHDIRTKLGQALRENNQLEASRKEFMKVLSFKPEYAPAHIQLGVTLYSLGKVEGAKKAWQHALTHHPQNEYAKMYLRLSEAQHQGQRSRGETPQPNSKKKTRKRRKRS